MAGTLTAVTGSAHAAPPPNPTDSQLNQAKADKAAIADQVGRLSGQVAAAQATISQLEGVKEQAEQKFALAQYQLTQAKAAVVTANANLAAAQQQAVAAQDELNAYLVATFSTGGVDGTTGALLTAQDPSTLLQVTNLEQYEANHQLTVVDNMQRATIAVSNAQAAARQAVVNQQKATDAAAAAQATAIQAVMSAQAQEARLQATLGQQQQALQQAQEQLATLNNQRTQYLAYVKRQQEIARQEALARARALAAARARAQHGGGGPSGPDVPPGSGGSWTLQAGLTAVSRAERWLGTMYAWAGGNADGPTQGVCAGDGAFNDCNVVGFDCSGLVMYAWAQFPFVHYAATQYLQGSYHPNAWNLGSLEPGDLIFWSSDGTVGGIHHVAIYIGNGNVIQAPQSGEVIQITPIYSVDSGLFGATRPLT